MKKTQIYLTDRQHAEFAVISKLLGKNRVNSSERPLIDSADAKSRVADFRVVHQDGNTKTH